METSSLSANNPNEKSLDEASVPTLKDGELGAILQRDKASYAIVPHLPCGVITAAQLRKIADVADKFGCAAIKLTSAQRIAMVGLRADELEAVWQALDLPKGHGVGDCVRSVKACPGTTFCKRGQRDSLAIGLELDKNHHGRALPAKFKIGVSGCGNQCAETAIKDIGLVGFRNGWDVWIGGSGGAAPKLGSRLARQQSDEQVLSLVRSLLDYYEATAKPKERFHRFIARIGIAEIARALELEAPEGIAQT